MTDFLIDIFWMIVGSTVGLALSYVVMFVIFFIRGH